LLALAVRFEGLLREGTVWDYAELARLGGVSRARMTQIMSLRNLAPVIQERILGLPNTGAHAVHRGIVFARVSSVENEAVNRPDLNLQGIRRRHPALVECSAIRRSWICPPGTGEHPSGGLPVGGAVRVGGIPSDLLPRP
jgi:hypothetical protein